MPDPKRYDEFANLIELCTSRVLSYLHALLLSWEDAEDVFQETCLVLWQKFDEFTPGTSFSAWALRVAQHKVMNFQKKQRRYTVLFSADLQDALKADFADRSSKEQAASLAALSSCMDRLTQSDQRMVKQSYIDDVPVQCIADAMGRSPESIHHSLRRIRNWLLDCVHRELKHVDATAVSAAESVRKGDGP